MEEKKMEVVEWLVEDGKADLNTVNLFQDTSLHVAAM